ncbi:MAG: glycosyltransferase [Oscillospiraceae bacterium]|jgi:glycosyltransferase EpsE|nr:glycosyltransferase [Oscillospiraceae bacterium]MBQ5712335.1 glycosyltransferase [Oscillospiraceae bacterium]
MKISVVMAAFNAEKYLREAMDSILAQTYGDLELIVLDDKSTDGSLQILKEYAAADPRVVVLENEQNMGLTKSLNKGLAVAKGEYIARMDADDISVPDRFAKQVAFLDSHPDYSFVSCIGRYIDEEGREEQLRLFPETHEEICAMMPKVDAVMHPGVMFRREDIARIGNYCEDFRVVQDYDLWFRGMAAGYKFYNIQEPLVLFRRNDSYNTRKSKAYRLVDYRVRKKGYKLNKIPLHKRVYLIVPLALAYIPPKVMDKCFYVLKRFDPRNKGRKG